MSFARFGAESDVYLYASVHGGVTCCACGLPDSPGVASLWSVEAVLEHLQAHRDADQMVPEGTVEAMLSDDLHGYIVWTPRDPRVEDAHP